MRLRITTTGSDEGPPPLQQHLVDVLDEEDNIVETSPVLANRGEAIRWANTYRTENGGTATIEKGWLS